MIGIDWKAFAEREKKILKEYKLEMESSSYSFRELSVTNKLYAMSTALTKMTKEFMEETENKLLDKANAEISNLDYAVVCAQLTVAGIRFSGGFAKRRIVKIARRLLSPKEAKYIRWAMVAGMHVGIIGEEGEARLAAHPRSPRFKKIAAKFRSEVEKETSSLSRKYALEYQNAINNYNPTREEIVSYIEKKGFKFQADGKIKEPRYPYYFMGC